MKEFTVGDMIKALEKLDPDLPLYDHYHDDDLDAEVWFNLTKPESKKVNIWLTPRVVDGEVMGEWTDSKPRGEILEQKKVVILWPMAKDEIEI